MIWSLLALPALASHLVEVEPVALPTLITNVRVLNAEGVVEGPFDVVLRDGFIERIQEVGEAWDVGSVQVVNGSGGTLLPGLVDAHVHVGSTTAVPGRIRIPRPEENLESWLYFGVTTVADLGLDLGRIEPIRRKLAAGRIAGPSVHGVGKPFTAPDGHPMSSVTATFRGPLVRIATAGIAWEVETAADVDAVYEKRPSSGFAKVMIDRIPLDAPLISDEALARIRERASERGERVVAHVGRPEDVERALALPVDVLAHAPSAGRLTADQASRIAAAGIPVIPTLVVWEAVYQLAICRPFYGTLEEEVVRPATARDLQAAAEGRALPEGAMAEWAAEIVRHRGDRYANVRLLAEAGVTTLVGSDGPNLGEVAGAGFHREIDLLAEAGLTPREILVAATWGNSRFLDPDATFGAVRPGWQADLLLVDGDPVENLDDVHDIRALWIDGRRVLRNPRR